MKKEISAFDYAGDICKAMKKGILLTTKAGESVNTMTIGWGTMGIEWGRPVFIAFVRESRYTRELLDQSKEFTVNIPYGTFDSHILGICGSKSGRDMDKIQELNLTLEPSQVVQAPGIKELPLTLECKVLYQQKQDLSHLGDEIMARYYPADVDSSFSGSNRDAHIAYYAEIVNAYLITEEM